MNEKIQIIFGLLGGLAVFIYGMNMMSECLQKAAGDKMKSILAQLNIADDYFKAKKQAEILEDGITSRDKEIFDLKHTLIDLQRQLDDLKKK